MNLQELFDTPINELEKHGLSKASIDRLESSVGLYLGGLLRCTPARLLEIRRFGIISVQETQRAVRSFLDHTAESM
jgi:hypothetical protein